jgi:hypothetical protein
VINAPPAARRTPVKNVKWIINGLVAVATFVGLALIDIGSGKS